MTFNKKLKTSLVSFLVGVCLLSSPIVVLAETIPTAPTTPTAPTVVAVNPTIPTAPIAPTLPVVGGQADTTVQANTTPVPVTTNNDRPRHHSVANSGNGADSTNKSTTNSNSSTDVNQANNADVNNVVDVTGKTGSNSADKNMGDGSVNSGNSSVAAALMNDINNNHITIGDLCGLGCSAGFVDANMNNGSGSLNNADGSLTRLVLLNNANNLNLNNTADLNSSTGQNSASKNMGGGVIVSGDADVAFTTVNLGNNNGINATTADYNILDNQSSDLWINFPNGTASGAGLGLLGADNIGNGSDSTNTTNTNSSNSTVINNSNDLVLNNDVTLYANTGNNTADKNMGAGNITTGNANVASNIINFLNNNVVAGAQWLLSTVNIFGNMTGNIILPRSADLNGCGCAADSTATNTGNGADSTNSATTDITNSTNINNINNADINNNLNLDANTGGNTTDKNMGDSSISTGNTNVDSKLVTVANTNAVGQGDTWWLVIVNNHGNYTGQIVGANDNTIAGSGMQFGVSPSGTVYALNSGNGADSTNNANTSSDTTTTINNTNNATINNNINIKANTGDNTADKNMDGATIKTGDVNVVSNIVNFINNNFVGKKFVVTLVNIFGSFSGKIVPPDQALPAAGGIGGPTGVDLSSSTTVSGIEIKAKKAKVTGAGSSSTNSLVSALQQGGKLLQEAASTQNKVNDSVKKVVSGGTQKSSFAFNYVLLGLALVILAIYAFIARRRAS